jgi:hypothetical protein
MRLYRRSRVSIAATAVAAQASIKRRFCLPIMPVRSPLTVKLSLSHNCLPPKTLRLSSLHRSPIFLRNRARLLANDSGPP